MPIRHVIGWKILTEHGMIYDAEFNIAVIHVDGRWSFGTVYDDFPSPYVKWAD